MTRKEAFSLHQCKACVLYDSKRMEDYVAGFIDGEGCFDVNIVRRRYTGYVRYVPRLRISQVGIAGFLALCAIKECYGGTIEKYNDNRGKRVGTRYTLVISGRKNLLKLLLKIQYRLIVKQRQARFIIEYFNSVPPRFVCVEKAEELKESLSLEKAYD